MLEDVGREARLYPGVEQVFDYARQAVHAIVPDVAVEFYVLTAGFAEVPSATPIAHQFKQAIWAVPVTSATTAVYSFRSAW